jgi:hypothetical protein
MNQKKNSVPSPAPVLVMVVLALLAMIQLFFPELISPGITLVAVGVAFLGLYMMGWVRDALNLILGWMLTGFGLSFWASTQPAWEGWATPLILAGLGFGFVAIYFTGSGGELLEAPGKHWPLVPALMLLIVATLLILEGMFGRQRLWSLVIPLIPAVSAMWFIAGWRRAVAAAQKA